MFQVFSRHHKCLICAPLLTQHIELIIHFCPNAFCITETAIFIAYSHDMLVINNVTFFVSWGKKPLYTPTLQLIFQEHALNCSCFIASGNCILTYESSCIFMQYNIIQKNEFTLLILSFCTYSCCAFLSLYSCSFVKC